MTDKGEAQVVEKSSSAQPRRHFRRLATALLVVAVAAVLLARFGGYLIFAPDPLPDHADAAVVLSGADVSTMIRFNEGVRLLREEQVDHVLLLVPTIYRWGEWIPDIVRRYIDREIEPDLARNIVPCEGLATSTIEEALVLQRCIRGRGWRSLLIVTSDFHTRRTKLIWRNVMEMEDPDTEVRVHGVPDGSFQVRGWWQRRLYAETWLMEMMRLGWYFIESMNPATWQLSTP